MAERGPGRQHANGGGAPGAGTEIPADAQLAPVGAPADASSDGAYDPDKHNGSGPGGLPVAEDFVVPHSEKRGRHRPEPGEKLH